MAAAREISKYKLALVHSRCVDPEPENEYTFSMEMEMRNMN
jgi:hypothetical protein